MHKIPAVVMSLALALFGGATTAEQAASSAKPNVVYILLDDAGINDLGVYGNKYIRTPNIDQLAKEGMRFTRHYSGSTVCAPSRSVLMTGQHTGHTTRRHNSDKIPLKDEDLTVAEVFKQAGYSTAAIGKWGLGLDDSTGAPNRQGFDYFFGYLRHRNAHHHYPNYVYRNTTRVKFPGNHKKREMYSHDLLTEEALNYLDTAKGKPFFLYVAYTIPHSDIDVPEDSIEPYLSVFPEEKPFRKGKQGRFVQPRPRAAYAGMMSRMDRDVGRIMQRLKDHGVADNTLVMLSSDNGAPTLNTPLEFLDSNGPYRGQKRDLYEGGIRAPMIAHWPKRIAANKVTDHLSGFQDLMATVVELTDTRIDTEIDGLSFLPTLLGQARQEQHAYLYWEFDNSVFQKGKGFAQAVIQGDWKLLHLQDGKKSRRSHFELYNLASDIGETNNLASRYPDKVKQLTGLLTEAHLPSKEFPVSFLGEK